MVGDGGQLSEFIDGLGPGQLVGRQVLGAPALGDIQLSLCYQKGFLEVEVIRARGLQVSSMGLKHNFTSNEIRISIRSTRKINFYYKHFFGFSR